MRKRLRRISVLQTSKVAAVLYGILGLCIVPFLLLLNAFAPGETGMFGMGAGLLGALIVPVLYAVMGFIGTALVCALYNVLAGLTGGIEFEVEDAPGY